MMKDIMLDGNSIVFNDSYRSYSTSIMSFEMKKEKHIGIDLDQSGEVLHLSYNESFVDIHIVSRSISYTSKDENSYEEKSICKLCTLF